MSAAAPERAKTGAVRDVPRRPRRRRRRILRLSTQSTVGTPRRFPADSKPGVAPEGTATDRISSLIAPPTYVPRREAHCSPWRHSSGQPGSMPPSVSSARSGHRRRSAINDMMPARSSTPSAARPDQFNPLMQVTAGVAADLKPFCRATGSMASNTWTNRLAALSSLRLASQRHWEVAGVAMAGPVRGGYFLMVPPADPPNQSASITASARSRQPPKIERRRHFFARRRWCSPRRLFSQSLPAGAGAAGG